MLHVADLEERESEMREQKDALQAFRASLNSAPRKEAFSQANRKNKDGL